MTAFETLYAHLKAMNYKDAPLFVDGQLLFLNVGENYHLLYSDNSLFIIDFVDSVIRHYYLNPSESSVINRDRLSLVGGTKRDYLEAFDKLLKSFFHLMPFYLHHLEESGAHKPKTSILDVWPEAVEYKFRPPSHSTQDFSTSIKYEIRDLFLSTIGWIGRDSRKAQLNKEDFDTNVFKFSLKEFSEHYPLADTESDKQSFYYCDYAKENLKLFRDIYKKEVEQLIDLESKFTRKWTNEFSKQGINLNSTNLSSNSYLTYTGDFNFYTVHRSPFLASKLLLKINKKDIFLSESNQNNPRLHLDIFHLGICLNDEFYFDGEKIINVLTDNYQPTLSEQGEFLYERLFTEDSLQLFISYNREQISHIAELLNLSYNNEIHSFFANLVKGVETDIAKLDEIFKLFNQYRDDRFNQLLKSKEILEQIYQNYLGDAPIV